MACCGWQTFEEGFLATWRGARHAPSELLIDWTLAKKYWSRYHCTGGEAAGVQLKALSREGDYAFIEQLNKKFRGGEGGGLSSK